MHGRQTLYHHEMQEEGREGGVCKSVQESGSWPQQGWRGSHRAVQEGRGGKA